MRRLWISLLVIAALMVPAGTAHAALAAKITAPSGGIGVRLVDVPTDSSGDPLARLYIINRLAPGTSVRRELQVSNSTRSTAEVAVYAAGAGAAASGFWFSAGHVQDQLSSWTSLSRGMLRLPSGTDALETVTISVPSNAAAGEDYAVIWAEVSAPSSDGGGVVLVNRVGIRMYVAVGPGGTPAANFTVGALTARRSPNGTPFVAATVHNIGEVPLDIAGSLTLSNGPGGIRGGPFTVTPGSIVAPGGSELKTVVLQRSIPNGPWKAALRLSSGGTTRSATATLTIPALASAVPASSHGVTLVITVLLVLLASAALALLLLRRRSRSQRNRRRAAAGTPDTRELSAVGSS